MTKPWADEIERYVTRWTNRRSSNNWWARYVYHYTDVTNAARILNSGLLKSRRTMEREGRDFTDGACREVIQNTSKAHKRFARLYYRPRTPTQYRNEGIRPPEDRWKKAHCPVPVFFLFDSLSTMGRDDAQYSNGNMGTSGVSFGPGREDFLAIPFNKVFHDGAFDRDADPEILFHRHAELLIPDEMDLDDLKLIACRSHAERSTLLHLMSPAARRRWDDFVRVGNSALFEKKWAFVDRVEIGERQFVFHFNPDSQCSRRVRSRAVLNHSDGRTREFENELDSRRRYKIKLRRNYLYVDVSLFLENSLAYSNRLTFNDLL